MRTAIAVSVLFCSFAACQGQQQPVHAHSRASAAPRSNATLNAAFQDLQSQLTAVGEVRFTASGTDTGARSDFSDSSDVAIHHVIADSHACELRFHKTVGERGIVTQEEDVVVPLKSVATVFVGAAEEFLTIANADGGHSSLVYTATSPQVTALVMARPTERNFLYFLDASVADKTAEALSHAVELCGGSATSAAGKRAVDILEKKEHDAEAEMQTARNISLEEEEKRVEQARAEDAERQRQAEMEQQRQAAEEAENRRRQIVAQIDSLQQEMQMHLNNADAFDSSAQQLQSQGSQCTGGGILGAFCAGLSGGGSGAMQIKANNERAAAQRNADEISSLQQQLEQ